MIGTGHWKWWGLFAFTKFSLIYCYPGVIFVLVVLNFTTLGLIAFGRDLAKPRSAQAGRWICVNVLAAILALQLDAAALSAGQAVFRIRLLARLYIGLVMGSQYDLLHDRRGTLGQRVMNPGPATRNGLPATLRIPCCSSRCLVLDRFDPSRSNISATARLGLRHVCLRNGCLSA